MTPDLAVPGVFELRRLERRLGADLERLDARVDALLASETTTDADVAQIDVLCAAIAERRELLEEARRDALRATLARRARRTRPRRWT